MRTRAELAIAAVENARQTFIGNLKGLTLEEALDPGGGYRSVLGILKHAAAWSHVYHSYAFDEAPKHWVAIDWPRGLRDTIDASQDYVDEVEAWARKSFEAWKASLSVMPDEDFDAPRPCHWRGTAPLFDIVVMVSTHWSYHAGELNEVLSISRGHAWEYTEEVEENHISTAGHRVRPDWMSEQQVARYEAYMAKRDQELRGGG